MIRTVKLISRLSKFSVGSLIPSRYGSQNAFPNNSQALLFTPGPLASSTRVKRAALRDVGSREQEFVTTISFIRNELLRIAKVDSDEYTTIPVQGSGTFALEAAFNTSLPRVGAKVLVVDNGTYGDRLAMLSRAMGADVTTVHFEDGESVDVAKVAKKMSKKFTHVAIVHCETSSGVINPVAEILRLAKEKNPNVVFFLDAMSSFGAMDVPMDGVDIMVSSSNKCIQGIPGFAYVIMKKQLLHKCEGNARSVVLDLVTQAKALDEKGQFWCTPPTHSMLAFAEALVEFQEEGGVAGRGERYRENCHVLVDGMKRLGFKTLLNMDDHPLSYIITSFHFPRDSNFKFEEFYKRLRDKGMVIYPGRVSSAECFRIGTIGDLWPRDVDKLLVAVQAVLKDMNVNLPVQ